MFFFAWFHFTVVPRSKLDHGCRIFASSFFCRAPRVRQFLHEAVASSSVYYVECMYVVFRMNPFFLLVRVFVGMWVFTCWYHICATSLCLSTSNITYIFYDVPHVPRCYVVCWRASGVTDCSGLFIIAFYYVIRLYSRTKQPSKVCWYLWISIVDRSHYTAATTTITHSSHYSVCFLHIEPLFYPSTPSTPQCVSVCPCWLHPPYGDEKVCGSPNTTPTKDNPMPWHRPGYDNKLDVHPSASRNKQRWERKMKRGTKQRKNKAKNKNKTKPNEKWNQDEKMQSSEKRKKKETPNTSRNGYVIRTQTKRKQTNKKRDDIPEKHIQNKFCGRSAVCNSNLGKNQSNSSQVACAQNGNAVSILWRTVWYRTYCPRKTYPFRYFYWHILSYFGSFLSESFLSKFSTFFSRNFLIFHFDLFLFFQILEC